MNDAVSCRCFDMDGHYGETNICCELHKIASFKPLLLFERSKKPLRLLRLCHLQIGSSAQSGNLNPFLPVTTQQQRRFQGPTYNFIESYHIVAKDLTLPRINTPLVNDYQRSLYSATNIRPVPPSSTTPCAP